jgi:hypothetical protein
MRRLLPRSRNSSFVNSLQIRYQLSYIALSSRGYAKLNFYTINCMLFMLLIYKFVTALTCIKHTLVLLYPARLGAQFCFLCYLRKIRNKLIFVLSLYINSSHNKRYIYIACKTVFICCIMSVISEFRHTVAVIYSIIAHIVSQKHKC